MENVRSITEGKQSDPAIIFAGGTPGPAPRTQVIISQVDLAEERILSAEAGRALRSLKVSREKIRKLLAAGARVETGSYTVEIVQRHRGPAEGCDYTELVVR